jgi:Transglycosylase-like domain
MDEKQKRRTKPIVAILFIMLMVPAIASASAEFGSEPEPAPPVGPAGTPGATDVAVPSPEFRDARVDRTLREGLTLRRHRTHLKEVARQRHLEWVKEQRAKKAAAAREAAAREAAAREAAAREAAVAEAASAPEPPIQPPSPPPAPSGGADWYAIAHCESGGNWSVNTGNGFWGGLQFLPSTWFAFGGGPFNGVGPFPYSAASQIAVAERVLASQGPGAWPNCFQWA